MIQTYPEMNEIIVDLIRDSDHLHVQYAAARIEELERQLREAAKALALAQARIRELEGELGDAVNVALAVAVGALEATR